MQLRRQNTHRVHIPAALRVVPAPPVKLQQRIPGFVRVDHHVAPVSAHGEHERAIEVPLQRAAPPRRPLLLALLAGGPVLAGHAEDRAVTPVPGPHGDDRPVEVLVRLPRQRGRGRGRRRFLRPSGPAALDRAVPGGTRETAPAPLRLPAAPARREGRITGAAFCPRRKSERVGRGAKGEGEGR